MQWEKGYINKCKYETYSLCHGSGLSHLALAFGLLAFFKCRLTVHNLLLGDNKPSKRCLGINNINKHEESIRAACNKRKSLS